jgi:hypothetical protein
MATAAVVVAMVLGERGRKERWRNRKNAIRSTGAQHEHEHGGSADDRLFQKPG